MGSSTSASPLDASPEGKINIKKSDEGWFRSFKTFSKLVNLKLVRQDCAALQAGGRCAAPAAVMLYFVRLRLTGESEDEREET